MIGLIERFDMEPLERDLVFRGFRHVFDGLPEANAYLTFDASDEGRETANADVEAKERRAKAA